MPDLISLKRRGSHLLKTSTGHLALSCSDTLLKMRYVPLTYQSDVKDRIEQAGAWCLALKSKYGGWEGFTSWDHPVSLPEYTDELGNTTPALTYQPAGAQMSTIPVQLKLGAQATDIAVHAPRWDSIIEQSSDPLIYLSREKVLHKWYEGAYWELFEVDPEGDVAHRMVWTCGELGNIQLNDLVATAELPSYDELANRTIGDQLHIICQVGSRRDEKFGTHRCWNEILHDGVYRPDWTVLATVVAAPTKASIRLSYGSVAVSGAALHGEFHNHLNNGDLEWFDAPLGGKNSGYEASLRGGDQVSNMGATKVVQVYPKLSLPYLPEVGDKVHLVAGCNRTKSDCIFYENLPNMRAQDLPGNDDLMRRTKL